MSTRGKDMQLTQTMMGIKCVFKFFGIVLLFWCPISNSEEPMSSTYGYSECEITKMKNLLDNAVEFSSKARDMFQGGIHSKNCCSKPVDCEDILKCGHNKSRVYKICPFNRIISGCIEVFCDMTTNGGGWTVIQRRGNFGHAKDYFYNNWQTYKEGFGDVRQDFWLGNDLLFALTNQKSYSLRFDLQDLEGNKRFAVYDSFWVNSEEHNYTMHVRGYSGDAGDAFTRLSGSQFTTKDRDNDIHATLNCAISYKGAWWYDKCHSSNLNGFYLNGSHTSSADGVEWSTWRFQNYSLPVTEMKIRNTIFYSPKHDTNHVLTPL